MELNKRFSKWLERRSYGAKNLLFLFLLIVAYVASIAIMEMENVEIPKFFLSSAIALASIYFAILIYKSSEKDIRIRGS